MTITGSDTSPVVVITGASAGVGRAVVREYARRGARLALLARGRKGLDGARGEAEELGSPRVLAILADVASAEQVERAAEQIDEQLGPPDIWINNAMASVFSPVRQTKAEEFARVTAVTYLGTVHGTLAALRAMLPRDQGVIIQVGSALAYRGIPLQAAYCAAKHAVQGFTESLRAELLHDKAGVAVSMVHLPALNTPQFGWVRTRLPRHPQPVPPIFQPEVAARAIVWAGDHRPRELNVGAPTVLTRVANSLAPGLIDRYLGATGFDSQQRDDFVDLARWRDNLDEPQDEEVDAGAHGAFDVRAKPRSAQLWAATHKSAVAGAAAGALVLGAAARKLA
ncbi:MAG TPA: SDR family oxidoreductase [Egibacteraceae bacterium]|nr:SDR family oxidoreductase [Egibacteraceae bacterium]